MQCPVKKSIGKRYTSSSKKLPRLFIKIVKFLQLTHILFFSTLKHICFKYSLASHCKCKDEQILKGIDESSKVAMGIFIANSGKRWDSQSYNGVISWLDYSYALLWEHRLCSHPNPSPTRLWSIGELLGQSQKLSLQWAEGLIPSAICLWLSLESVCMPVFNSSLKQ